MPRVKRARSNNANIIAEHQEPAEVLSQLGDTNNPQFTRSKRATTVAASGVLVAASDVLWDRSLFSLENRCKHKTTDTWLCTNENQCVPDKQGRSGRIRPRFSPVYTMTH